jgi:hypothetical protein
MIQACDTEDIRAMLPDALPKWRHCDANAAAFVANLISTKAVSVGAYSINKDTDAWRQFWNDGPALHDAIVKQDHRKAGFVKPANVLKFNLLTGVAFGLGYNRISGKARIVDMNGHDLFEHRVICDTDIEGDENKEMLGLIVDRPMRRSQQAFGITIDSTIELATEQQEPLLLLADYAAGIVHAALLPDPGRIPLPLAYSAAKALVDEWRLARLLAIHDRDFDFSYGEIFGASPAENA